MERHVRILGILHIIGGGLWLLGALTVGMIFGGIAGVLGFIGVHEPDATIALPIIGFIGTVLTVMLVIFSIPSIVAGFGLLNLQNWARILTIVLSALYLFKVPIGTAVGIYGLWVLLSPGAEPLFRPRLARPAGA